MLTYRRTSCSLRIYLPFVSLDVASCYSRRLFRVLFINNDGWELIRTRLNNIPEINKCRPMNIQSWGKYIICLAQFWYSYSSIAFRFRSHGLPLKIPNLGLLEWISRVAVRKSMVKSWSKQLSVQQAHLSRSSFNGCGIIESQRIERRWTELIHE